jgi:pimeloyl-ACP methyl ester carboxylesterase
MTPSARPDILLVMVPGMGMVAADFAAQGLTPAVEQRGWPVAVVTADPGPDAYLDGSVETRLLRHIEDARHATGANRVWLAGISLGCQGILRCVRQRPGLAEGVILLTPYLANTGLIAEVTRTGGLLRWSAANTACEDAERTLLRWLAATPVADLPRILVGRAQADRFAATATLLADLLPAEQITSVPGAHDWASWRALWDLILQRNPFEHRGRFDRPLATAP